jgi:hypothetical protein
MPPNILWILEDFRKLHLGASVERDATGLSGDGLEVFLPKIQIWDCNNLDRFVKSCGTVKKTEGI